MAKLPFVRDTARPIEPQASQISPSLGGSCLLGGAGTPRGGGGGAGRGGAGGGVGGVKGDGSVVVCWQ